LLPHRRSLSMSELSERYEIALKSIADARDGVV
jgi:hypothetical protein